MHIMKADIKNLMLINGKYKVIIELLILLILDKYKRLVFPKMN